MTASNLLLIGAPNSGKSALFNRLTGLNHKVANYPGITVDVGRGVHAAVPNWTLWDFPGAYSLTSVSAEEAIAIDSFHAALDGGETSLVAIVLDATRLDKGLTLSLQVAREAEQRGIPTVLLLNMIDVLNSNNLSVDAQGLAGELGFPVLPVSARTGEGLQSLSEFMIDSIQHHVIANRWTSAPNVMLSGTAQQLAERFSPEGDLLVRRQTQLDNWFLGSVSGGLSFIVIMTLFFQAIFTWSAPLMDGVEGFVIAMGESVAPMLSEGMLADFVSDAIFGGVGAFLVFVPQVFILTLLIGALEDSGYLARAALICHRPLSYFGLTGKSFVPLLSGVACAIPAIYAARTMSSMQQRLMTYLAIPLMPCSARLPVYALLIAVLIPDDTALGGLIGWQGLALSMIYFFGISMALLVAAVVSRMQPRKEREQPFILELPPYRPPMMRPIIRTSLNRAWHFITKAGAVIFGVTVVVWFLGYFPNGGSDLNSSWLAILGRVIQPLFEPLGLDWRYGVAILASFLAREVFVGTLGTIFGIEAADENVVPLADRITESGLTAASGAALMVFFTIALQCVSTVALLAREAKSSKFAVVMMASYFLLAWIVALLCYWLIQLLL